MSLHNKHFYFGTMRAYVVAFGNIFNSIHVVRFDKNGEEVEREKVPLAYGPKHKYIYRNEQNPDLNEKFAIKLPRISFEMIEIKYDPSRKTPSTQKLRGTDVKDGSRAFQYNAVPYEFLFDVNIMAKNTDEALQIVEQILPFFTPDYTMTVNVIPELNHKLDIPVTIASISMDDNWDTDFKERRDIVWNMQLVLKGFIYAPIRDAKVILQAEWDIRGYDDTIISSGIETKK